MDQSLPPPIEKILNEKIDLISAENSVIFKIMQNSLFENIRLSTKCIVLEKQCDNLAKQIKNLNGNESKDFPTDY